MSLWEDLIDATVGSKGYRLKPAPGKFAERHQEMASWWNSNLANNARRPGETLRDWKARIRESWTKYAKANHLSVRTGVPRPSAHLHKKKRKPIRGKKPPIRKPGGKRRGGGGGGSKMVML